MANDDDALGGPVPAPDAEPTASERAHAKTFAELVDKTLAGRMPAAMSADDRALLEVTTVIRAAHVGVELPAGKSRALVEDVLRQAVGGAPATSRTMTAPRRTRAQRWAPWIVAATSSLVAIAAIMMLWLRPSTHRAAGRSAAAAARIPTSWTSRPSDPLIGPIARDHAGDASARLDYIFADRLDGYRERRLARGGLP